MAAETPTHEMWSEDLAWQAQRGLELGRALCTCDGYYHTLWGSLRIAGLNNTMKGEAPILASLLSPFLRDNARVALPILASSAASGASTCRTCPSSRSSTSAGHRSR